MIKNKIIAFMTCGALITAGIAGGTLISNKNSNTNEKTIQNHILLSAPDLNDLAVVINTNINPLVLYSSPNSNSNIESYISVGEMLNYTATSNPNFYKVTVQETGATGYISASNMQIIQSGLNKAYENINKNGQVINVTYDVKLMSSPSVHSQILGGYKNNSPMIILGKQNQWYKVEIGNQTGYMYQSYVGIDTTTASTSTNSTNNVTSAQSNNIITLTSIQSIGNNKRTWTNSKIIPNNMVGKTVYTNPNYSCEISNTESDTGNPLEIISKKVVPLKVLDQVIETPAGTKNNFIYYKVETPNGVVGYINQSLTYISKELTNPDYKVNILNVPYSSGQILKTIAYKEEPLYVINQVIGISSTTNKKEYYYEVSYGNGFTGFVNIHNLFNKS